MAEMFENINIEEEKERVRNNMKILRVEAETLIERIDKTLTALEQVQTIEDATRFDEEYFDHFEDDLEHIELFQ